MQPATLPALGQTRSTTPAPQPMAPTPRMPRIVTMPCRTKTGGKPMSSLNIGASIVPLRQLEDAAWDDSEDVLPDAAVDDDEAAELLTSSTSAHRAPLASPADDALLAALIQRIVHQDQKALEQLYDCCAARVHGVVLRITRNAALAEEVVEDCFWQVWRQAPRFDAQRGRPLTWLLAIARSRAIDALRRDQRFAHEEMPEDDSLAQAAAGAAPAHELLAATQNSAALHAALAALSARERQLVSLAFLRGFTHEEIAQQQALPLGTVKSLIRRALLQLKSRLEAQHVHA
jgi:RNA polymerase sigma factor (sigma-70 family)